LIKLSQYCLFLIEILHEAITDATVTSRELQSIHYYTEQAKSINPSIPMAT